MTKNVAKPKLCNIFFTLWGGAIFAYTKKFMYIAYRITAMAVITAAFAM
jgi:hypothetical protein